MKFEINKFNYKNLPRLAEILRLEKTNRIEIRLSDNIKEIPRFLEIAPFLYKVLDYESFFEVWLKNFPFCVVLRGTIDHILPEDNFKGEKIKKCEKCLWNKKCSGFPVGYFNKYGYNEVCAVLDTPEEIMIEITPKCNFDCEFCFNKISFAQKGRNIKEFSSSYVKKIINAISESGVKVIRFTGGEPLLRKDIFELLKYAKNKNLEVRLNTNGSLINSKTVKKLRGVVDNVLIPIESDDDEKESKLTNYDCSLKKKIEAIKLLKKEKIPVVRAGTVAVKENILNFDKMARFVFGLPLDEWELYRPVSVSKKNDLNSRLIKILVEKLIGLRKKTDKAVFIANALPFCAIKDLNKISSVSKGALFDDGHSRLVIDPRGFVKPHYFIDKNIGDPLDILGAWHHPFVKKMRGLNYLPDDCKQCAFVFKCCGGSRQAAKIAFDDYKALDPLIDCFNK